MGIRIKNWKKFQHFKDRRPPWIKLYRDLLEDVSWHELKPDLAKTLINLWLLAAEKDGELPDTRTLAFRLRSSETQINRMISELHEWLEHDDIKMISNRYQVDTPETEREIEIDS
jgi:DNA gyrase inhibitor GyrI